MLLSPGHSPRHISSPSPSPAPAKDNNNKTLTLDPSSPATAPTNRKRGAAVLDEDTYVASIERIIERDFFPDIPKLQDRLDWLGAVRSGDPVLIRDAQLKILERRRSSSGNSKTLTPFSSRRSVTRTPSFFPSSSSTPFGGDKTPLFPPSADAGGDGDPSSDVVASSSSLDDFFRRYTSEDNESFSKLMEKTNRKRRERYAHLLEGEHDPQPLALEDEKRDRITDGFGTSGQPLSTLDGCKYKADNLLMYVPVEEVPLTVDEMAERSKAATKEIARSNTRFHGKSESGPAKEDEAVAILYAPVPGTTPAGASWPFADREDKSKKYDLEDLRKTPNLFYVESGKKADNGYNFVKTPSPAPGVEESPFMTWGEIEGTPLRLDLEDTPVDIGGSSEGPHFRIPQPPSRDVRAHLMSREASRKIRERSKMFQKPPLPSPARAGSSSPNVRTLSPAAQKFYRNAIAKSDRSSINEALRASYRGASPLAGTPKTRFSGEGSLVSRSPSSRQGSTPPW